MNREIGRAIRHCAPKEFDVVVATSGREALTHITQRPFDVILCDLMMPDLSGVEVYSEIARENAAQAERIVFLSGGSSTPRMEAFLATCSNAMIQKPVAIDALRRQLRALVGRALTPVGK